LLDISIPPNIIWSYGYETIPRHLRDIVITEYGIADLRGRTDEEIIASLLNVADSRFQQSLLKRAKAAGKICADYRIPEAFRNNPPARLAEGLRDERAATSASTRSAPISRTRRSRSRGR
jgi:acyl-CoA hydrolase